MSARASDPSGAARPARSVVPAEAAPAAATALERHGRPLYRQLADDLRRRILRREFDVGSSIPTEATLSAEYRTSRITVRHALSLLEREGLLHREQGRGSFIRPRSIAVGPRRLTSFSEEVAERGQVHASELVAMATVHVGADAPLDLGDGDECVRIERVRKADGAAIAHQVTYLPVEFGLHARVELERDGSLYSFLRRVHAIDIDSADETYRVAAADVDQARLLGVAESAPVFVVERVGFSGARRVEWTLSTVRGEDYEVHVHLRR